MADDDVIDYLPESVRQEMERQARERDASPVHAQARVVTLKPPGKTAATPSQPAPPQGGEPVQAEAVAAPPLGSGPESFDPAGTDYKAFGWASNKTVPTLLLIFADGREKAVVYGQLDSDPDNGSEFLPSAPGQKGSVLRLRVAGSARVFFVVIEGAVVRHVWELIMAHKTPWIRVLPPGGVPTRGEPVIWSIAFEKAK
jgi:hypothetical protein